MRHLLPVLMVCMMGPAVASEVKLEHVELAHDPATLRRGAETVTTACMGCHNLKYIKYRDLIKLGMAKDTVDALRGEQTLDASLKSQMSAEDASASFGGAVPPDLSLMAAARAGGGNYLYSYLTGYHTNDKGELANSVFSDTRMPDVLGITSAADDAQRNDIRNQAKEVSAFLVWAADPHAEVRKRLGYYVLAYVAVMTLLLFLWKNRIWREIDRRPKI